MFLRWSLQLPPAGLLVLVPLLVGFVTSVVLAEPFLEVARAYNHDAFALTDHEKVEGAKEVHHHELRLRMDAAIGRSPPINEAEMQVQRQLMPSVSFKLATLPDVIITGV